jgi:hypothetical protein
MISSKGNLFYYDNGGTDEDVNDCKDFNRPCLTFNTSFTNAIYTEINELLVITSLNVSVSNILSDVGFSGVGYFNRDLYGKKSVVRIDVLKEGGDYVFDTYNTVNVSHLSFKLRHSSVSAPTIFSIKNGTFTLTFCSFVPDYSFLEVGYSLINVQNSTCNIDGVEISDIGFDSTNAVKLTSNSVVNIENLKAFEVWVWLYLYCAG